MKRLIDTNAYVAFKQGHPGTLELVRSSQSLLVSLIVIGELMFGFHHGSRRERNVRELDELLSHPLVEVLEVSRVTADRFGRIAAQLKRQGTPIPTNDIWIAAQAMETGAELVTFDRHFDQVPGLVVVTPG